MEDEQIAVKMLSELKRLQRRDPDKPRPDVGWMLAILDVVRECDEENEKENKMYEFTNVGYAEMQKMPEGKEKAICYGVSGLLTDGGHHKQWAIEEMLKALGVDLNILRKELREDEYDWYDGIAP